MKAYNVNDNGNAYPDNDISAWNETVTISINQEPNYLYMDHAKEKELITIGLRNINLFGPSGLPLLPPIAPWFATLNIWTIEVQGRINKFEVQDIDNEVHPDSIFGHGAQVYVRKRGVVEDPANNNNYVGDNSPIEFSFTTGTFIVVPPKSIGDIDGKPSGKSLCIPPICEESPQFNNITG